MGRAEGRWRLIDPEMDSGWTPEVNGRPVDWLGPRRRPVRDRAARVAGGPRGHADPERHVVHPDLDLPVLRGWPYIAHNAIHDLAALNKTEMLLWDGWGMQLGHGPGPVPEADAGSPRRGLRADRRPCASSPDAVAALGGRDGLRVPPMVTSFDPTGGPPRQVDVSRVLSRG